MQIGARFVYHIASFYAFPHIGGQGRYAVVTGKTEKRYQEGAERDEKKDCKFCDDLGVSAGNADMRSLQVRREKRYQDGAERGEKKDCEFYDDLDVSAGNAICGRYR